MSFQVEIAKPIPSIRTLMSIRPRFRLTGWTVNGTHANVYQVAWTERHTVGLYCESFSSSTEEVSLTDCASSDDSWFHDSGAGILYFNPPGTGNPNTLVTVVEWDLLLATDHLNWYRDPQDSSSEDAVWEGGLVRPPVPTQGNPDLLFGYSPIQVTEVQAQIADGWKLEFLHAWSLNGSQVRIWECAGELDTANFSEIFTGVAGEFSMSGGVLSIAVADPLKMLDKTSFDKYFSASDFAGLDPSAAGLPIRTVMGFLPTFAPVNIDYDATPAVNKNRDWVVCDGEIADAASFSSLIDHLSGSNDATHTEVADASGLFKGDTIIVEDNSVQKFTTILDVDYLNNIIEHDSIGSRSPVSGDQVVRSFVASVTVTDGQFSFPLLYGRDYVEADFANDTRGFVMADDWEGNTFGSSYVLDPSTVTVSIAVYGSKVLPKKLDGITDFGELTDTSGAVANPVVMLWDILRNRVRNFRETVTLDEAAWSAMVANVPYVHGIAIPETLTEDFPSWRDVVQKLLATSLLRMHFKVSSGVSLLTVTQTAPTTGDGTDISEDQISSLRFNWSYADVYSKIRARFNGGEYSSLGITPNFDLDNSTARYLHRVERTLEFQTLLSRINSPTDIDDILRRLSFIFSERKGTASGLLPVEFTEAVIDGKFNLGTTRLPGFAFSGSTNERVYKLQEHEKSSSGVSVVLDDQKGVEDNAGSW